MLENWCWEAPALATMSKHYKTGEPIPEDLITKLVASKNANAGHFNKRQLVFGLFDQRIHSTPDSEWGGKGPPLAAEYAAIIKEVMGVPASDDTCMPASFGHLAGGYDAQYYGYMWSEVFSADMFERINRDVSCPVGTANCQCRRVCATSQNLWATNPHYSGTARWRLSSTSSGTVCTVCAHRTSPSPSLR